MVNMTVYSEVKRLYSSLQEMVGLRRRKRQLQISEPFDFKREATIIPGITEDEISVLREKAAASRLGIAHADDTYSDTILPLPYHPYHHHHHHHHHHHRLRSRASGGGPLSLSPSGTAAGPPRLCLPMPMPMPIPIPGGNGSSSSRQGSGSSSLRSCCSSTLGPGPVYHSQGGMLGVSPGAGGGGGGGGGERVSSSMNDLDLLLFGNPSGVGHDHHPVGGRLAVGAAGQELVMPPLGPVVSAGEAAMAVSPLELDGGLGGGGGGVDWGMEFEFQMGSPVSPLSPASRGKRGL